jgi:hypothetical protein
MSATNPTPTTPDTEGRDERGRFAEGNTFGGNPFARKVASLRAALLEAVTEQDVREIGYVLLLKAQGGDLASTKLLFQYVLGKPQPFVSPDRLAIDALRALEESAVPPEKVAEITRKLPVEFALELARLGLEGATARNATMLGDMIRASEAADEPAAEEDEPARRARWRAEAKERKRRRKEARRKMKMRKRPSTNGGDGKPRPAKARPAPSTTAATVGTGARQS